MAATAETSSVLRGRIAVAALISTVGFSVVTARLVDVMVFGAGPVHSAASIPALPNRADLVDRNALLIARDLPVSDLYASPAAFWDTGDAAHQLAAVTGADEQRLHTAFRPAKGYILVQHAVTPDMREAVMRLGLPGLDFVQSHKRFYPAGRTVAHAVGQVDTDDNGVSGLELGLEQRLRNQTEPVQLSIDLRVQYVLEHEAREAMRSFRAKARDAREQADLVRVALNGAATTSLRSLDEQGDDGQTARSASG